MSALTRFLAPASRRSYSSYFSSKSGGGRYFNSAKPSSKAPTPPSTTKDAAANVAEIQKQDVAVKAAGEAQAASVSASSSSVSTTTPSAASTSSIPNTSTAPSTAPTSLSSLLSELNAQAPPVLQHPTLSAKDLKLHQFFAMGRPLLLLNQPASILRPVPAGAPLFSTVAHLDQQAQMHRQKNLEALGLGMGLDAPVDPFIDADAEAARQLTRALTMNKASAALQWENTLRQLGLDVSQDADRVNLPQQFARDWEEILADSTKRKRRKKMKKHKMLIASCFLSVQAKEAQKSHPA
ncbi:hypothetical protein D9619_005361 [Psilocybe cf. subviscida]|uniref:Uncharacterized protein n=1 Tax=Psilocybe cf. subviscida TaxID=2480587 RepID=A0A8H5BW45_9AGAR|nr:hypothetical protein D9619_005361 [Psilocybe cf. subviscida]